MGKHTLQILREEHRFSSAHMTVFPDGSKERLHGHNFQLSVRLSVRSIALAEMCDFSILKRAAREVCAELHERTLVALNNPYLRVSVETQEDTDPAPSREVVRLSHPSGEYLLPRTDVMLLPLENITSEQLARWAHGELSRRLRQRLPDVVEGLEVGVLESPGQGGFYEGPLAV